MARRRIDDSAGRDALNRYVTAADSGTEADRPTVMTAVRWALEELAERAPGRAVEVRVPPAGAVQILGGTVHRRGTPPAVVEMQMGTWLQLVTGRLLWADAVEAGLVQASGERADLQSLLPLT